MANNLPMTDPGSAFPAELKAELDRLAGQAAKTGHQDREKVLALAEEYAAWAERAQKHFGTWATGFSNQAKQLAKGLRAGRPSHQGLERILQAVLEVDKHLREDVPPHQLPARARRFWSLEWNPGPGKWPSCPRNSSP